MRQFHHRLPLDWLRGLAALMVLISHAILIRDDAPHLMGWLSSCGHVAVDLFFAMSGLVIALAWERAPDLRLYTIHRAYRIFPAMWALCAFIFPFAIIYLEWGASLQHALVVILHAIGMQSAIPLDIPGLFVGLPLWTISVEIQFYLILPLIWSSFKKHREYWVVSAFAMEVCWRVATSDQLGLFGLYLPVQLPGQAFNFASGMLMAAFLAKRDGCVTGEPKYLWVIYLGLAMLILEVIFYKRMTDNGLFILIAPIVPAILVWASISSGFSSSILASVGKVSYGLYLWHFPALYILNIFVPDIPWVAYLIIGLATSLLLASLSYKMIEAPVMRLAKEFSPKLVRGE